MYTQGIYWVYWVYITNHCELPRKTVDPRPAGRSGAEANPRCCDSSARNPQRRVNGVDMEIDICIDMLCTYMYILYISMCLYVCVYMLEIDKIRQDKIR